MAEIPEILRPELQALPQIADRMTFLLFPAHAGVILPSSPTSERCLSIPRTRGGDPPVIRERFYGNGYSPHTRG